MPRVFYLIADLGIGGAEQQLVQLVEGIDRHKFDVTVCSLTDYGQLAVRLHRAGIPVVTVGMKKGITALLSLSRLYRLIRSHKPDILHGFMWHSNILGRIVGRVAGVPYIISSERTMGGMEGIGRIAINRLTMHLADIVTANSEPVRDFIDKTIGVPVSRLFVIPNGVSERMFCRNPQRNVRAMVPNVTDDTVIIGTISQLRREKGHAILLRAVSLVVKCMPSVKVMIVGDGLMRAYLEQLVQQLQLDDNVMFVGEVEDVLPWLRAMDVFVLASDYEGMPNAVIEAMAVGLPVVATGVGGTTAIIKDGVTGLLVPPRDPERLASAILSLANDPVIRAKMGRNGRALARQSLSMAHSIQLTEELYCRLLETSSRKGPGASRLAVE